MATTNDPNQKPKWTEQVQAAGEEVWKRGEDLVQEGNVRRMIIRNEHGDILLQVPLIPAVVIGGILTLVNPVLAVIGVIAALLAHLKFEIVRKQTGTDH